MCRLYSNAKSMFLMLFVFLLFVLNYIFFSVY